MSDTFNGLRTRLEELADAPAPASTFDPVRVAATGRRRVLAARTSAVGGGAVLAVAAVLGIVAAFGPGTSSAATPGSGVSPDPLVDYVDFGWLPASLPNVSYWTDPTTSSVTAVGDKSPDGAPRVDLQLLPGKGPGTPNAHERLIPATLNDGRRGYWLTQSPTGGQFEGNFELRFPAKDGKWISLAWSVNWNQADADKIAGVRNSTTTSGDSAPPASVPVSKEWQQTLLRMATQVTDSPKPIPMPLRLTGLPPNLRPNWTYLWHPAQFGDGAPGTWTALLVFESGKLNAQIVVGPHGTQSFAKDAKCMTSAGLDACVESSGSSPGFDEVGGAKGLLKHITLLGTDENQWTTNVIVP